MNNMINHRLLPLLLLLLTLPVKIFAQLGGGGPRLGGGGGGGTKDLESAAEKIFEIIKWFIPITFSLVLIYFFWGLVKYVMSAGDDEKKKEGRSAMIYGVIGMFVAAAIWGIVSLISLTFLGTSEPSNIWKFPVLELPT